MNILNKLISAVCLTVALSSLAQANLIENGSFEDVGNSEALGKSSNHTYGSTTTWQIYDSIPNWSASENVEIWNDDFIVDAYAGSRILELNAHPANVNSAFSIYQQFDTVAGQTYQLSFAGRKRRAQSDEAFSVSVGDLSGSVVDFTTSVSNQAHDKWTVYNYSFIASSDSSILTFTSLDTIGDTTGNLFDDVRVVPEPSVIMLMVAGIAGLVARRKKA